MVRELLRPRILVTNRPANAAHLANAFEVCFPHVIRAETVLNGFSKPGIRSRLAGAICSKIPEIEFMEDHAIVFEPKPPLKFRVLRHCLVIYLSAEQEALYLF